MSRDFDVLIVGAGAIGTTMAALLLARGQTGAGRVALIAERMPGGAASMAAASAGAASPSAASAGVVPAGADWDLRVFALSRASQRLLRLAGAWPLLPAQRMFAYERMCVWDAGGAPGGAGSLSFDCAQLGEPNLGHIVDGRALGQACLKAALGAGAVLIEGSVQALRVDESEARIRLADGRDLGARLLIGADGGDSKTRELLGIETAGHTYHQDALVAHVRTAKAHESTAWQRFLPGGPLALLPLADGRSSIVWSVAHAEAQRLRALDAPAFGAALEAASDAVLGEIELSTEVASFALHLKYALDYVRPRAVLLGDAAHAVHPLAGQGLNLGLLDCASLAQVLEAARGDPALLGEPRLLRRYERWRKSENLAAAAALDGLERLFSSSQPLLRRLRSAGLGAVGRLPLLKRELALRALGLAGDVPALLKYEDAAS
ncbi:MAG TPA: FAD-dependent monooxygenase [Steroidobacteraceae bacterium]|nr:FAD-dependent monooxygenase [Steroidobacteraceae bacterium]